MGRPVAARRTPARTPLGAGRARRAGRPRRVGAVARAAAALSGATAVARLAAATAVLGLLAAVPGPPAVAAGAPGAYDFTGGARTVTGAATTADAPLLDAGRAYRSALPRDGKLYYRLRLDAASSAYVSATAVPAADSTVSATDGVRVSVRDGHGDSCSYQATLFGTSRSPHPVSAWGRRDAAPGHSLCQGAGTYYVLVERIDASGASPDAWPLELATVTEPALSRTGATTAPGTWDSARPEPVGGRAADRAGGAGFATASPLGQGVWRTGVRPGQTLFYRVPVDWGQQLNVVAELGGAGGSGYVDGALTLSLYNPVRGYVEDAYAGYSGRRASAALAPLPPVDYANRYGFADPVKAMRFAGSYYLVAHLADQTAAGFGAGPYDLTLRVRLGGSATSGPGYAGRSEPRDRFEVTAADRAAAAPAGPFGPSGAAGSAGAAGGSAALRALAVGGIGTGTALLVVLGGWTLVARRRSGAW
ncbi:hypothetical protein [Streptomyces similanensis]|uniref:hypothetical protein n=1 Tax=Streptomyces similanensis TaxID=1274988 RepID=UPI003CD060A9